MERRRRMRMRQRIGSVQEEGLVDVCDLSSVLSKPAERKRKRREEKRAGKKRCGWTSAHSSLSGFLLQCSTLLAASLPSKPAATLNLSYVAANRSRLSYLPLSLPSSFLSLVPRGQITRLLATFWALFHSNVVVTLKTCLKSWNK